MNQNIFILLVITYNYISDAWTHERQAGYSLHSILANTVRFMYLITFQLILISAVNYSCSDIPINKI